MNQHFETKRLPLPVHKLLITHASCLQSSSHSLMTCQMKLLISTKTIP